MSYTQSWAYQPSHPGYVQAWPTIVDDTRRVIAELFGTTGSGNPLRPTLTDVRFDAAPSAPAPVSARSGPGEFREGQRVHVHAYGNWRPGAVTTTGRSRVTVRFTRNADEDTVERAFAARLVRPADGVTLVPVHQLRPGQTVIRGAGDATVADVQPGATRRYRRVVYTDGTTAQIAAQTVMRVRTPRNAAPGEPTS